METIVIDMDVRVFGIQVKTFPAGVGEVFDALASELPEGRKRSYYGLSAMDGEGIVYYAAVEAREDDDPGRLRLSPFVIPAGEYFAVPIRGWMNKIHRIKEVFHEMLTEKSDVTEGYCIEWYRSDEEMICMMKKIRN